MSSKFRPFGWIAVVVCAMRCLAAEPAPVWPKPALPEAREVQLGGAAGAALQRGISRLAQPPYSAEWLLSDVSFQVNRIFTNYSGDVSGRFIELASLTSPPGQFSPATLQPVLNQIAKHQKADGHFGLEMDFTKPMQRLSPPIPMLWGNARLLAGLVTTAREYHDTNLLVAARRLGDFYVTTADIFCSPTREAELRGTGTGGDGYTCCYFPAIEGLVMLYRATQDERFLQQARRMAEWFKKFDALPTDHSHGNLYAWRGILELYNITGDSTYLNRALAKWETAVQDGYVWPIGGVGEHWYLFHNGDEGCSESDWLRFNLDLWRYTGETRFLDMAERLLVNQYPANQCPNGGYGWRHFDGDASGPIATRGTVDEWNFCCSFHGPLGLHFLKTYLAVGSDQGIHVNFPLDFTARVKTGNQGWVVTLKTLTEESPSTQVLELELVPAGLKSAPTTLWLRQPDWATNVKLTTAAGTTLPFSAEHGYVRLVREFKAGEKVRVAFQTGLRLERRRFQKIQLEPTRIARLRDVAVQSGPEVLFAAPAPANGRMTLLAQVDAAGQLSFWKSPAGGYLSVTLPGLDAGLEQMVAALESRPIVALRAEANLGTSRRTAFMHDVIVVPSSLLPTPAASRFMARAQAAAQTLTSAYFGENLEKRAEVWNAPSGWQFTSNSLHVTNGDVGLLDGEGYADYRFEFDLELPLQGQGMAGWVVRAKDARECVLFQLQSADSPYQAPQYKTRPNSLRPHIRHHGEWDIAAPVSLPKEIRRGERHHIATECRGDQMTVFLDGEKIFTQTNTSYQTGTVGFRATGVGEQGLFRNISLKKL